MTKEEFDAFLAPLGLTWYNGQPITDSKHFAFNAGWYAITAQLITDLIALGWDKTLIQAKEKFGGGRFYADVGNKILYDRITQWTKETFETCEDCGTKDKVTTAGSGWIRTLCDNCRQPKSVE